MKKGWIKLFRRGLEWAVKLSDAEFRYYLGARLCTVWDSRKKDFGTFDGRTESVKEAMRLTWSTGKINTTKKSLIKKGLLKQMPQYRIKITNADIFLGKGARFETMIQEAECNLHSAENYVRQTESRARFIKEKVDSIALSKRVS